MSIAFFIFGFLQFVTGYCCLVGYEQSKFVFDESQYTNISKDSTKIVVYFSRMGYTKKLAYEIANEKGAEILEIKTNERIQGNLGFWWCGRYGMHKWGMPILDINVDFAKYSEITICTPTWVFGVSAPVREFCKKYSGQLSNVGIVTTHFMNARFDKIAKQIDNLLNVEHTSFRTFRCRFGKTKELKSKQK